MVGNYQRVTVDVSEWGPESEVGEPSEEWSGELEEMYADDGTIMVVITHPDGDTVTDVQIPIQAKDSWNEFVESLPRWD